MFNKKKKNNKGFTLVELLVVIAIIGILAVVAVPSLFKQVNKAKATDVVSYLSALRTAAMSEYAATGKEVAIDETTDEVKDRPEEVTTADVAVNSSGTVTMSVTVKAQGVADELKKQSDASFGTDSVTITPTPTPTPSE